MPLMVIIFKYCIIFKRLGWLLMKDRLVIMNTYVSEKPPTPVIINFTCSYNNERTVTFDRGPQGKEYNDIYNITMLEGRYAMLTNDRE